MENLLTGVVETFVRLKEQSVGFSRMLQLTLFLLFYRQSCEFISILVHKST